MNALVGRLIPPDSYGKAYGLTSSMTCLGMAAGPFFGGIMASWWGYRWPFVLVSAMIALVACPSSSVSACVPAESVPQRRFNGLGRSHQNQMSRINP